MEQSIFLEKIRIWEHHIHFSPGQSREEKHKIIFEENLTGLLQSHDKTHRSTVVKPKNDLWSISGDFIYRHHVEPLVKLYMPTEESFPIPLKYFDVTTTTDTTLDVMSEKRTLMETQSCRMHGQVSQDSLYWMRNHLMDIHGLVRDWQENTRPPDQTMYGQICGNICLMHRNAKRSKSGQSRNSASIMPENYVSSSSLNLMMRNSSVQW